MSLVGKASSQYGAAFVIKAKGPPWPVNKKDGGGGLIGFTPLKTHPAAQMGPVAQLDEVAKYQTCATG